MYGYLSRGTKDLYPFHPGSRCENYVKRALPVPIIWSLLSLDHPKQLESLQGWKSILQCVAYLCTMGVGGVFSDQRKQCPDHLPATWVMGVTLHGRAGPKDAQVTFEQCWLWGFFCLISYEVVEAEVFSVSSEFCLLEAFLSEGDLLMS